MKKLRIFLALLTNAMLLGLLLLVYLDGRNPYYYGGFLASPASKVYLVILGVLGLVTTCLSVADLRHRDDG